MGPLPGVPTATLLRGTGTKKKVDLIFMIAHKLQVISSRIFGVQKYQKQSMNPLGLFVYFIPFIVIFKLSGNQK